MLINPPREPQMREKLLGDLASLGDSLDTKRLVKLVQWAYDLLDQQIGSINIEESILELYEEHGYGISVIEELHADSDFAGQP